MHVAIVEEDAAADVDTEELQRQFLAMNCQQQQQPPNVDLLIEGRGRASPSSLSVEVAKGTVITNEACALVEENKEKGAGEVVDSGSGSQEAQEFMHASLIDELAKRCEQIVELELQLDDLRRRQPDQFGADKIEQPSPSSRGKLMEYQKKLQEKEATIRSQSEKINALEAQVTQLQKAFQQMGSSQEGPGEDDTIANSSFLNQEEPDKNKKSHRRRAPASPRLSLPRRQRAAAAAAAAARLGLGARALARLMRGGSGGGGGLWGWEEEGAAAEEERALRAQVDKEEEAFEWQSHNRLDEWTGNQKLLPEFFDEAKKYRKGTGLPVPSSRFFTDGKVTSCFALDEVRLPGEKRDGPDHSEKQASACPDLWFAWEWVGGWTVDCEAPGADKEGWQYKTDAQIGIPNLEDNPWNDERPVRRRRWRRRRVLAPCPPPPPPPPPDPAAPSSPPPPAAGVRYLEGVRRGAALEVLAAKLSAQVLELQDKLNDKDMEGALAAKLKRQVVDLYQRWQKALQENRKLKNTISELKNENHVLQSLGEQHINTGNLALASESCEPALRDEEDGIIGKLFKRLRDNSRSSSGDIGELGIQYESYDGVSTDEAELHAEVRALRAAREEEERGGGFSLRRLVHRARSGGGGGSGGEYGSGGDGNDGSAMEGGGDEGGLVPAVAAATAGPPGAVSVGGGGGGAAEFVEGGVGGAEVAGSGGGGVGGGAQAEGESGTDRPRLRALGRALGASWQRVAGAAAAAAAAEGGGGQGVAAAGGGGNAGEGGGGGFFGRGAGALSALLLGGEAGAGRGEEGGAGEGSGRGAAVGAAGQGLPVAKKGAQDGNGAEDASPGWLKVKSTLGEVAQRVNHAIMTTMNDEDDNDEGEEGSADGYKVPLGGSDLQDMTFMSTMGGGLGLQSSVDHDFEF